jgi:quercetin dioxygenase-like cupin family protein
MGPFATKSSAISCVAIAIAFALWQLAGAQATNDAPEHQTTKNVRLAFSHDLPRLEGSHLKATIVEVTYGPGESSPPHSHPCPVVGYVIEGALRTQVRGEAETIYRAGESFYEAPDGVHQVSANASGTRPVKFLAYFVCDHDAPLSAAVAETPGTGSKQP